MEKTNEQLCKEIQENNSLSLELLIKQNTNLIYSLMKRFNYSNDEKEDIFSCAKYGLIKASKNFNTSFNCVFTTYAVPLILGEIKKYFRDNSSLHISRSYKDLYKDILRAQEILEKNNQKSVSLQEISNYLNVSYEDVLLSYEAHYSTSSLDASIGEDDLCLGDLVSSEENLLEDCSLNLALQKLDKKERLLIQLRYFDGYTQQEVAQRLFISQVQVSRLEKKILGKLKINI